MSIAAGENISKITNSIRKTGRMYISLVFFAYICSRICVEHRMEAY